MQQKEIKWYIYIPEEGDWEITPSMGNIKGPILNKKMAREVYLNWVKRKRLPANSKIWNLNT